jgi:soluble lytic murein transglycosylase-like protein
MAADPAQQYLAWIQDAAKQYGISPAILFALLQTESGFDPNAVSHDSAGNPIAYGIAQFTPETAQAYGVNVNDPQSSIYGAAHYLSDLFKKFGNYSSALAAYNAGPQAVTKYGGVPPYAETQNYVAKVLAIAQSIDPAIGGAQAPATTRAPAPAPVTPAPSPFMLNPQGASGLNAKAIVDMLFLLIAAFVVIIAIARGAKERTA